MMSLTTLTATSALMHCDRPQDEHLRAHGDAEGADGTNGADGADGAAGPGASAGGARRTRLILATVLTVVATSMLMIGAQRAYVASAAQPATVAISAARGR